MTVRTSSRRSSRLLLLPLVAGIVPTLGLAAACSSGKGAGSFGYPAPAASAPPVTGASDGLAPPDAPGKPVSSLSCDMFSVAAVQAAFRTVVPSAKVVEIQGEQPADGMACHYRASAPSVDPATDDQGVADVSFTLDDGWLDLPEVDYDRALPYTPKAQAALFEAGRRESAKTDVGTPDNDSATTYHDSSGVGGGSYVNESVTSTDSGDPTAYVTKLYILHTIRPFSLEVTVDYVLPDGSLDDKSVDTAMRSEDNRVAAGKAVGQAVLSVLK
jgi:hypothetical protein